MRGFDSDALQLEFDRVLALHVAYWCCRVPDDMKRLNVSDLRGRIYYTMLPPHRQARVQKYLDVDRLQKQ